MHRHRLISFAEEICKQDPNLCMDNLDANSLFTNIPLTKPLTLVLIVCLKIMRMPLRSVRFLFEICLMWPPKTRFLWKIDDLAMRSPLAAKLANVFMCSFEDK